MDGLIDDALAFEPAQSYWLLSSFCTIHQRAIEPNELAKECSQPLSASQLAQAGEGLGLDVEPQRIATGRMPSIQPPFALRVTSGETIDWLIVLQAEGARA